ncbi:hypothetical protein TNCV_1727121 [Trichonephila clavipes]|nr:hypothetical protein TNCV_1727121 [Trichonephila clavipes]
METDHHLDNGPVMEHSPPSSIDSSRQSSRPGTPLVSYCQRRLELTSIMNQYFVGIEYVTSAINGFQINILEGCPLDVHQHQLLAEQENIYKWRTEILASRRLPSSLLTTINLHERQLLLTDDYARQRFNTKSTTTIKRASATFSSTNLMDYTVRRCTAHCQPLSTDKVHNQSPVTGNSTGYIKETFTSPDFIFSTNHVLILKI